VIEKRDFNDKKVFIDKWVRGLKNLNGELSMMKRTCGGCHINATWEPHQMVQMRGSHGCHVAVRWKR
jgi:hypothetical protein